jgi:nucleoside-diphosphate-sugar epimerase
MARALIIGCGCRGRALGGALLGAGWHVRGSTRSEAGIEAIEEAGIEATIADPDAPGTILYHLDGVALVYWLMGAAEGDAGAVVALHGSRLKSLMAKLVDTPVRGFVYEGAGGAGREALAEGARVVRDAQERWRIPGEVTRTDPADPGPWLEEMVAAAQRMLQ